MVVRTSNGSEGELVVKGELVVRMSNGSEGELVIKASNGDKGE